MRILDEVKSPLTVLAIQRISRLDILQFHCTANVTCIQLVNRDTISTCTGINLPDALFGSTVGIGQVITRFNTTAHHLEI